MFKIKSKILKKLSAGFMAGLCAFSMLGSTMSGVITANAASTSTENSAFPSADTVIAKAATLLGSPYTFGNKGILVRIQSGSVYSAVGTDDKQSRYRLFGTCVLYADAAWIQDFGIFLEQPRSCGYRSLADGQRQLHYQLRR